MKDLFGPFQQLDASTSRKYGGTGLGLVISKKLCRIMGGDLTCASRPERGSTFTFTIPANPAPDSCSEEYEETRPLSREEQGQLLGKKVLLVEDNPINTRVAESILKKPGVIVDSAANGKLALDKLQTNDYDLIFMDCQMPEMDGYEATRRIRNLQSNKQDLPIVALTANAMSGDMLKCIEAGMDDYISKPVRQEALAQALFRFQGYQHSSTGNKPS